MVVLGLDPGIDRLGWGVIEHTPGGLKLQQFGLITTDKTASSSIRLAEIGKDVTSLIMQFSPDVVYIEKLFFSINAKTAMLVSEVRGVIKAAVATNEKDLKEIHPMQLKKIMVGTGKAKKKQITEAVMSLFALEKKPKTDDVADAIAIAYVGILESLGQL